jgi:hypothetical protein
MPSSGAAVQPVEVPQIRCPRCWFSAPFVDLNGTVFRCGRCEWKFSLTAATVSSPAVPSSGTATTNLVTNSTGTVVAVTITGGTLTFVYVNGVQAGTTAATYLVPVAGTISITYSVAPTWTWALPAISSGVSAGGTALPFASGGTAFAANQVLIVDPSGTSDVVVVTGTPGGTSVPVNALNSTHLTGVLVTVAKVAPTHPSVQVVPATSY